MIAFMGFCGVLIRLSLSIPETLELPVQPRIDLFTDIGFLKLWICVFCIFGILYGVFGLFASDQGDAAKPEYLIKDEIFDKSKKYKQSVIINIWIEGLQQYRNLFTEKQFRLNRCISCFGIAATLFGIAAGLSCL